MNMKKYRIRFKGEAIIQGESMQKAMRAYEEEAKMRGIVLQGVTGMMLEDHLC